jgi:hypothetical protein
VFAVPATLLFLKGLPASAVVLAAFVALVAGTRRIVALGSCPCCRRCVQLNLGGKLRIPVATA